ncbi:hypothetical protein Baya_3144 [Bagarius yarrelli]|uniref:Ig-like domain-containing protein n=1 Tax=Bagarius yarrelli TaxID=175774 RepID=A0A556TUJ6_BAGYA|nr:hypothetical protein Baya_3144 [Bagarius yarrelli]
MALTEARSHRENKACPGDVRLQWHSNGRRLKTAIKEYRHALGADTVLVSSWVKEEPLGKDTQYQCSALSWAGNDTSRIDLRLSSRGNGSEWRR